MDVPGQTDAGNLFDVIDRQSVHGLNLEVPESARELIKPWNERDSTEKYADSSVDDQLVIHVPFTRNVRIRSILLKLGRGETTPRSLRIYTNKPEIVDFQDADEMTPTFSMTLPEGEVGVVEYPVRGAGFVSVHSVSLHFSESVGQDVTRLYYIGFKGDSRELQEAPPIALELPAANSADASLLQKLAQRQSTAR